MEFQIDEPNLKEIDKKVETHYKNKGFSSMTLENLDEIFD